MTAHKLLALMALSFAAAPAFAQSVSEDASAQAPAAITIWLTDQPPSERAVAKSDRATGVNTHMGAVDLRFAPEPLTARDASELSALDSIIASAKERWLDFESEYDIASQLDTAVSKVGFVGSDRDRSDIIRALLLEGSAVARVFDPDTFATLDRAAPYRVMVGDRAVPLAWLDAWALMGKSAERTDLVDGTAWAHYRDVARILEKQPLSSLEIPAGIGEVFVDGRKVEPGVLSLAAGRHWIHVARDGYIANRRVIRIGAGEAVPFPANVSAGDLALTRERVLQKKRAGYPESVDAAIEKLAQYHHVPIFLAAMDGHKVALVGVTRGATVTDQRLVTVVLAADIGGGVVGALPGSSQQPIFTESADADDPTKAMIAGAPSASLSAEIGISYFLLAVGVDGYATPGRTIAWSAKGTNHYASVMIEPWGGLGAYFIRPTKRTPTVALYSTLGWMSPALPMFGGRLAVGIPIDERGNWFRFVLGGSYAPDTGWTAADRSAYAIPQTGTQPAFTGFLRVGFGARL